jgi:uncharacterized protein YlxP (DUF503 family)
MDAVQMIMNINVQLASCESVKKKRQVVSHWLDRAKVK